MADILEPISIRYLTAPPISFVIANYPVYNVTRIFAQQYMTANVLALTLMSLVPDEAKQYMVSVCGGKCDVAISAAVDGYITASASSGTDIVSNINANSYVLCDTLAQIYSSAQASAAQYTTGDVLLSTLIEVEPNAIAQYVTASCILENAMGARIDMYILASAITGAYLNAHINADLYNIASNQTNVDVGVAEMSALQYVLSQAIATSVVLRKLNDVDDLTLGDIANWTLQELCEQIV